MHEPSITVKPLNPDNDIQLRHVTALFERSRRSDSAAGVTKGLPTGGSAVTSQNYWRHLSARKCTPMLAVSGRRVVAHCGFGISRHSQNTGIIFHPVVDAEFSDRVETIAGMFSAMIDAQTKRRNLSTLVHFGTANEGSTELLESLGLVQVTSLAHDDGLRQLSVKLLERERRALDFVPSELKQIVSSSYAALGVSSVRESQRDLLPRHLSADEAAIDIVPLARMGRALVFVNASLLMNASLLHETSARTGKGGSRRLPPALHEVLRRWSKAVVCVNMADHGCGALVDLLKANDFEYQGILPGIRQRDSLLFARDNATASVRALSVSPARRKAALI